MSVILLALLPPVLWATVNHLDKYLLSKAKHHSSVNVLMVYSTCFSVVILPIAYYFGHDQLFLHANQIIVQICGGILLTASIYFYLLALNKEEASKVIPLSLLVPVFGYFFSFVLLGEVLTVKQIIACLLIVFGALILSLEITEERKLNLKHGVLMLMILCSSFLAAQETLFKYTTINNSFIVSIFWLHVGIALYGLILLLFKKNLWGEFIDSVRNQGRLMFGVNFLSETINALAYIIRDYLLLLAPIAIVMSLNGYQPAFVFILGTLLTIFFPKWANEKIQPVHLLHKGVAITIMIIGTVLIAQTL